MQNRTKLVSWLVVPAFLGVTALAQNAPNVSQVLIYSGTSNSTIPILDSKGARIGSVTLSNSIPAIFSTQNAPAVNTSDPAFVGRILDANNFAVTKSILDVNRAVNASIATALSVIPLASPASGVIFKTDPATGAELPASSTLGPIFTERAETIGKHRFFAGVSQQNYHFTSLDGKSLNSLQLLYPGGDQTNLLSPGNQKLQTYPASFNLGLDVRLSQTIAFLTYGVTNRFDVSVGLPSVHAAVAGRTFNGKIYAGGGAGAEALNGNLDCWCANTFAPGSPQLTAPSIGSASMAKTGFGDLLLRFKGTVSETSKAAIAVGADVRLPTGDETNFFGAGAASVKPFIAVSLFSKPKWNGVVFSPHINAGWQFIGKSSLAGDLTATPQAVSSPYGDIRYLGPPFKTTKDYLPDVFSWNVGTEIAVGRRQTFVADLVGNQIGWIHGMPTTRTESRTGFEPCGRTDGTCPQVTVSGLVDGGRVALGQYSGAFGFKTRVAGNLVVMFNALVRFDNNGLTARFVPLYGLGYSF